MAHWQKLGERMLYDGYRTVLGRQYILPNGNERELEIKLEGPTAVVLALTPEDDVLLVREFRPGVEEELLELPGGAVDEGEEPLESAESCSKRPATAESSSTQVRWSTARTRRGSGTPSSHEAA